MNRRPLRMSGVLLGALLAAGLSATPAGAGAGGPVALFDGKTLDGWKKVGGGATYRVDDGAIVGTVGPGPNTFLRTEKTYGDFRLELDCKLDVPGNSGIQFRSHQDTNKDGTDHVFGYQCEIDPSPRAWTAGLYDEGRRGWLFPLTARPEAQKSFKPADWNHLVIEARGPHLQTWVNGVACADLLDAADLEGSSRSRSTRARPARSAGRTSPSSTTAGVTFARSSTARRSRAGPTRPGPGRSRTARSTAPTRRANRGTATCSPKRPSTTSPCP